MDDKKVIIALQDFIEKHTGRRPENKPVEHMPAYYYCTECYNLIKWDMYKNTEIFQEAEIQTIKDMTELKNADKIEWYCTHCKKMVEPCMNVEIDKLYRNKS